MRNLFFLLLASSLFFSCSNNKSENIDDNDNHKPGKNIDKDPEEKTETGWSSGDKDKLKAEWKKTFATMKEGVQDEDDFDEADFDRESKKVVSCTLKVLENKFDSYAEYKKASNRDHFQSDPDLLNEMGNCTDDLMNKYNREGQ